MNVLPSLCRVTHSGGKFKFLPLLIASKERCLLKLMGRMLFADMYHVQPVLLDDPDALAMSQSSPAPEWLHMWPSSFSVLQVVATFAVSAGQEDMSAYCATVLMKGWTEQLANRWYSLVITAAGGLHFSNCYISSCPSWTSQLESDTKKLFSRCSLLKCKWSVEAGATSIICDIITNWKIIMVPYWAQTKLRAQRLKQFHFTVTPSVQQFNIQK